MAAVVPADSADLFSDLIGGDKTNPFDPLDQLVRIIANSLRGILSERRNDSNDG